MLTRGAALAFRLCYIHSHKCHDSLIIFKISWFLTIRDIGFVTLGEFARCVCRLLGLFFCRMLFSVPEWLRPTTFAASLLADSVPSAIVTLETDILCHKQFK